MKKKNIFLILAITTYLVGCETEQTSSDNSPMADYSKEHAKKQAEFANEEWLKQSKLIETTE